MLVATYVEDDNKGTHDIKREIMRYTFLAQALLYKQAVGTKEFDDLVKVGICTEQVSFSFRFSFFFFVSPHTVVARVSSSVVLSSSYFPQEHRILTDSGFAGKYYLVYTWISEIFKTLADTGRINQVSVRKSAQLGC